MRELLPRNPLSSRTENELEQQSEWALSLTRAASPDNARKLGETAGRILHRVVSRRSFNKRLKKQSKR
jgi:hypothetical protein